jgi:hypothetical protein
MVLQRQTLTLFRCGVVDHMVEVSKGVLGDSGDWKVWQVPVNLATDAFKMISLEELQNASMCWKSKRTITHINSKRCDCWDIAINGQQYLQAYFRRGLPLSKVIMVGYWWQLLMSKEAAPTINKRWPPLLTKEQEGLPLKPINRGIIWRAKWERVQ